MSRTILVIEDDTDIAHLVALHLRDQGWHVEVVHQGHLGLRRALATSYDLIVLDLLLPGMAGLDICRQLRTRPNYTPILMLTAKSTELDRVLGLELGADDYLTKPFSVQEFVARVKALFRRIEALQASSVAVQSAVICAGELCIEAAKRNVEMAGQAVALTAKEFDLLLHFAQHPGRVYSRAQLLDLVWGDSHEGYEHTVNSHINRLRAKIERDPRHPRYVLTVWGVGYKFAERAEE